MSRFCFLLPAAWLVLGCSSSGSDASALDAGDDSAADSIIIDTATDSTQSDVPPGDVPQDLGVDGGLDAPGDTAFDASTDGGSCGDAAACTGGLTCCDGACRNTRNDPFHCGGCGTACSGDHSMCLGGSCVAPICSPGCSSPQICCEIDEGVTTFKCVLGPTCPVGCPGCK